MLAFIWIDVWRVDISDFRRICIKLSYLKQIDILIIESFINFDKN